MAWGTWWQNSNTCRLQNQALSSIRRRWTRSTISPCTQATKPISWSSRRAFTWEWTLLRKLWGTKLCYSSSTKSTGTMLQPAKRRRENLLSNHSLTRLSWPTMGSLDMSKWRILLSWIWTPPSFQALRWPSESTIQTSTILKSRMQGSPCWWSRREGIKYFFTYLGSWTKNIYGPWNLPHDWHPWWLWRVQAKENLSSHHQVRCWKEKRNRGVDVWN